MMAGFDVHDATLGIVGFGAIGQAIARRARGFGMHTLYWNRTPRPEQAAELGVYLRRFDALLAESDFVSLSVALTEDTHHLIDAEALAKMQPHAILVNTARGPIVDEAALIDALRAGQIAGAGPGRHGGRAGPGRQSAALDAECRRAAAHWLGEHGDARQNGRHRGGQPARRTRR